MRHVAPVPMRARRGLPRRMRRRLTNGDDTKTGKWRQALQVGQAQAEEEGCCCCTRCCQRRDCRTTPPRAKAESGEPKTRAPRAKREPKAKAAGEPSKTLVFVANLAFATPMNPSRPPSRTTRSSRLTSSSDATATAPRALALSTLRTTRNSSVPSLRRRASRSTAEMLLCRWPFSTTMSRLPRPAPASA